MNTLIGSNGAGKTTTLHGISNVIKKTSGSVVFGGNDITAVPPDRIVASGLVQVPEGRRIFANLSVKDNLEMGAYTRKDRQGIRDDMAMVFGIFPRLKERLHQIAGTLSGGEQQMLAISRALMSRPSVLMLDEPSLGLAPIVTEALFDTILQIRSEGVTVLLVEQNAFQALEISDRGYVMQTGAMVAAGSGEDLLNDDLVRDAYLGG